MKTTLGDMLEKRPGMTMLQLKQSLQDFQKRGILYMDAELLTLELDQSFSVFYARHRRNGAYTGPFPVPADKYKQDYDFNYLKAFYLDYYRRQPDDYDLTGLSIVSGTEFIWYTKP
jgi:hypothetical protein